MTAGTHTTLLTGRSALITGASSGIGAAAARIFCREGAAVTLVARREQQLADLTDELRAQGHQAQYVVADVTHTEQIAHAVQQAITTYGHLDTAFNNAGTGATPQPMHLLDENAYDTVMDTNVRGVWNSMRHEIRAMLTHGKGTIVNNSSTAGLVATPVTATYIASKHAVLGLTKAAACEYATHNIRVNAIAPGTTRTEMITNWLNNNPTIEQTLLNHTPLPRMAHPNEIAEAAAWLSSDHASYILGTTLTIDGGWTTH
ncbi:SDR family NAD(P)-dependent oxidoreductase [Streptomyces avidinii]|uniref:NAD(P)-dependent dehydrogenase (Short-subunit alcohol dehydrogenase family) n=1 Tax=Streptomyces avidinii TaxID=1895 RepID=A0ABS4KWG6_STRAV|nr:glucose 1-dehydrogenase [Streptomyces avidinii]MBP2034367.1 NAD(P)-dependent dehydrogenase (short-subunit alcohol dehydrogenase family) [Streptomyces avidinii]GGZ38981.1 2,5-dichloro-2,5-cyclohexadiene-1,4-diol dehydrogenase [Streptomyces avidinii]